MLKLFILVEFLRYKLKNKQFLWENINLLGKILLGMILRFIYLLCLKLLFQRKKIKNLDELETFIQTKSAWVTQVTLYGYLKTRMGTRYVLHFENDEFMSSVNLAKWNIYAVALQDLTFFTFSYLKANFNYKEIENAKRNFFKNFR